MSFSKLPGTAAWRHGDEREGFEVVSITVSDASYRLDGHTAAVEGGQAWVVRYVISLDENWITKGRASGAGRARATASCGSSPMGRGDGTSTAPRRPNTTDVSTSTSSHRRSPTPFPCTAWTSGWVSRPKSRPCTSGPRILALSDSTSTTSGWTTTVRTSATTTARRTSASRPSSSTMNSGWYSNTRALRPASCDSAHQRKRRTPTQLRADVPPVPIGRACSGLPLSR